MWIATPSPWWTLTTDFLPVSRRTRTKEWNLPKEYPKRSPIFAEPYTRRRIRYLS
jgi:hypothetical protein